MPVHGCPIFPQLWQRRDFFFRIRFSTYWFTESGHPILVNNTHTKNKYSVSASLDCFINIICFVYSNVYKINKKSYLGCKHCTNWAIYNIAQLVACLRRDLIKWALVKSQENPNYFSKGYRVNHLLHILFIMIWYLSLTCLIIY